MRENYEVIANRRPAVWVTLAGKYPVELGSLQNQTKNLEVLIDWEPDPWVLHQAPTSLLNQMAYLFKNPRYILARDLVPLVSDIFRPGQSFWPDESCLDFKPFGINTWETFLPTDYEFWFWEQVWNREITDRDDIFILASYRTSNDGNGDYLLVDGLDLGVKYHTCALHEYVLNGDILFDGSRNQVNVISDGMTMPQLPKYCLRRRMEANGGSALIQAETPSYNGLLRQEERLLRRESALITFMMEPDQDEEDSWPPVPQPSMN